MKGQVVLIAGGVDKGLLITLEEIFAGKVKQVMQLGRLLRKLPRIKTELKLKLCRPCKCSRTRTRSSSAG